MQPVERLVFSLLLASLLLHECRALLPIAAFHVVLAVIPANCCYLPVFMQAPRLVPSKIEPFLHFEAFPLFPFVDI